MKQTKCIKMIDDLTKQIHYLKDINYGFYGFDINDILVVDESIFLFCCNQYILELEEDILISYSPINKPYFGNPEIFKLTTIPSLIHYKCIYYSLGILVVFCLINIYLLVGNEIKDSKEIEIILKPLKDTKIYWFLKRCFEENSEKRLLLLI